MKLPTETVIKTLKNKGFKVNVDKTQWIIFGNRNKDTDGITIDGKNVQEKQDIKYLGMTLDKTLTYKKHIKNLTHKGNQGLSVLKALGN